MREYTFSPRVDKRDFWNWIESSETHTNINTYGGKQTSVEDTKEKQTKTTIRYHNIPTRMAKMTKTDNAKYQ